MTIGFLPTLIGLGVLVLLAALVPGRRSRSREEWNRRTQPGNKEKLGFLDPSNHGDQLKAVEAAILKPKKPVNRSASVVLRQLEEIVKNRATHRYRVFAEISLGAFVASDGPEGQERVGKLAWKSINAKRVDFLIIDTYGHPAVAVEYHGPGHHHEGGQAAARDAVKRRALEKAGIELVEIQTGYDSQQSKLMVECALERYENRGENTHTSNSRDGRTHASA